MPSAHQLRVQEFVDAHRLSSDANTRVLDLMSEAGELAKEMLKATEYGKRAFAPTDAWSDEIGDVYFALLCLANTTQVDLNDALAQALAKYAGRLAQRGDASSGA